MASSQASLSKQTEIATSNILLKVVFHVIDVFILLCGKRPHLPSCAVVSFLGDYCDKTRNSSSHVPAKEQMRNVVTVGEPAHQTLALCHIMNH